MAGMLCHCRHTIFAKIRETLGMFGPLGGSRPQASIARSPNGNQEKCMNKVATRVLTLAMFSMAVTAAPLFTKAYAAGSDTPSPPPASDTKEKKKGNKSSSIEDPKFLAGYRTAYTTIYDRHDYA